MNAPTTVVIDGEVVDAARATVSVFDRAFLYGDGLFEVLRTWNGRAVDLVAHVDRLAESADFLRLTVDRDAIVDAVQTALRAAANTSGPSPTEDDADALLAEEAATAPAARATVPMRRPTSANSGARHAASSGADSGAGDAGATRDDAGDGVSSASEWRVRIIVTRGPGGLAVPMASAGPGQTIVIVEPLGVQPEEMSLAIVDWPIAPRVGRGHKTLAYLDHVIARELARDAGADDAVRLDAAGRVAEGGTCNVFVVKAGEVIAPDAGGVLPGVTAARVREVCRRSDIPFRIEPIEVNVFLAANEVFVTSALRGVVAVTRIGDRALPSGEVTQRIRAAYVGDMTGL